MQQFHPQQLLRAAYFPGPTDRFALDGDKLKLFSVAHLVHISDPRLIQRECSERIVWINDSGTPPDGLALPPKHFFAARQADGSHRFYGSNGP